MQSSLQKRLYRARQSKQCGRRFSRLMDNQNLGERRRQFGRTDIHQPGAANSRGAAPGSKPLRQAVQYQPDPASTLQSCCATCAAGPGGGRGSVFQRLRWACGPLFGLRFRPGLRPIPTDCRMFDAARGSSGAESPRWRGLYRAVCAVPAAARMPP